MKVLQRVDNVRASTIIGENIEQLLQNLAQFLAVLQNHENTLQAIRQALTLKPQFNPETLYKYLCDGESVITRREIIKALEQNGQTVSDEELKLIFAIAGCKQKMDYYDFINFVYPYNVDTLKTISTINAKKYGKNGNQSLGQEILCLFLMAIKTEATFLHQLQSYKSELFYKISRDKIKKMIKAIKLMGENNKSKPNQFMNDLVLNNKQLKLYLKKLKKSPQNKLNTICRKLAMGKQEGLVNLQQLEFWLKPWSKLKFDESIDKDGSHKTLLEDISCSLVKDI